MERIGEHEPTEMIYNGRSNHKHHHNTRRGSRSFNHWFNVYRCPVCGRPGDHRRLPIICSGWDADLKSGRAKK